MLGPRRLVLIASAATLLLWTAFLLYPRWFVDHTYEDGPIEVPGTLAALVAAVVFAVCGVRAWRRRARWSTTAWFLGLGLLFLLAFGEELSWGQRIFGWEAPESFAAQNTQRETNLHNLRFLHCQGCEGTIIHTNASGLPIVDAGRVFAAIIVGITFMLPLGYRFVRPFRRLVDWFAVPVPPLWPGIIAFGALLGSRLVMLVHTNPGAGYSARELMETLFEVAIALVAIIELRRSAAPRRQAVVALEPPAAVRVTTVPR